MLNTVFTSQDSSFQWLDVVDPSGQELELLHNKYGIFLISLQDCLDPKHPPKYEELQGYTFIILRSFDVKSTPDSSTMQDLTEKLAIFIGENFLITLHRREQPYLTQIRDRWIKSKPDTTPNLLPELLGRLVQGVLSSYSQAFSVCENQLEDFETVIFNEESTTTSIQDKFLLKRKAYVFRRVLKLTLEILNKLKILSNFSMPIFQDLKESADNMYFEAENILDHVNSLISLNLSLASHGTNEIVKILTIFTCYFMPLSLIASIYGMNFEHMPELKWQYGYPIVIAVMLIISFIIYLWFKKRGWLR